MNNVTEIIQSINKPIQDFVWGPIMLTALIGVGVYLTIATKGFQFTHFFLVMKKTIGSLFSNDGSSPKDKNKITPFQAMSTAIASTVGVGNVAGIATAIVSGGAGAVFWMWISAIFGMMTKYGEVLLAVKYRQKNAKGQFCGGPMYYIEKGLNMKWLAVCFSVFGAIACFGIGNMNQSNEIASAVNNLVGIEPIVTGIITAVIVGVVIIGGIGRISKMAEMIVPFMALFYIAGGLIALWINRALIPDAFSQIFAGAFSLESVGGGIMGYAVSRAMRYGFARGVFSNEAGLGSAPIAHSAADTDNPVHQAMWGIFEVFIDTIIICTLTALVVITSGLAGVATNSSGEIISGGALTSLAYQGALGSLGGHFVSIAIIFFAFSTILGWSYYGQQCVSYLTKNSSVAIAIFRGLFVVFVVVGAVGDLKLLWDISDTLNGLMAIPNLIGIILLSKVIIETTRKYLHDPDSVKIPR